MMRETICARSPDMNWTGEILTDSRRGGRHVLAHRQAVDNTHSPSSLIRPLASAAGMNSQGGTCPRIEWRQRRQGFKADNRACLDVDERLIFDAEPDPGFEGIAQVHGQAVDLRHAFVEILREDAKAASTFALGLVERDISPALEFGAVDLLHPGHDDADRRSDTDLYVRQFEAPCGRDQNAPADLLRCRRLAGVREQYGEFVASQSRDGVGSANDPG